MAWNGFDIADNAFLVFIGMIEIVCSKYIFTVWFLNCLKVDLRIKPTKYNSQCFGELATTVDVKYCSKNWKYYNGITDDLIPKQIEYAYNAYGT